MNSWTNWVAIELSTGNGFDSRLWTAVTPQHMRNSGSNNAYQVIASDFNGDSLTDLAVISKNWGPDWNLWIAVELSTRSGFSSAKWPAVTPQHMRNGGGFGQ